MVLYIMSGFGGQEAMIARLGKVKTGGACLYINRLDQVDMGVLREIAVSTVDSMREKYPD